MVKDFGWRTPEEGEGDLIADLGESEGEGLRVGEGKGEGKGDEVGEIKKSLSESVAVAEGEL